VAQLSREEQQVLLQKAGIQTPQDLDISFDEIDSFGDKKSLLEMIQNVANYNKMLGERITLINDSLTAAIPFTRENLYLFCALSGSGKSTIAANISYPLWQQTKKILVVSNEETKQDVLFRIAALHLGYSFNEYKKGQMPMEKQRECLMLFPEISKFVKVLDVTWRDGLTTKIEGVKKALESVRGQGYSCVLIDYYQLIKDSLYDRDRTRYDVLNDLRIWLGQYIKKCEIPVCLFVQLYSMGKKGGVKDIDARIKECSAIVEPATVIIEAVPNFEDSTTDFIIWKDRFGVAGHKITCPFSNGRYLKQLSERELAERKLDRLSADFEENELDEETPF
jgi:hypothetical protein